MNDYNNSSDRPRGRKNFGPSRFDDRRSGRGRMFEAVCADCGETCQVPFMPTSGKPVYCSNCFEKRGNGRTDSRRPEFSERRSFSAPSQGQANYDQQFAAINVKLDRLLSALNPAPKAETKKAVEEKPAAKKPAKKKAAKKKE